MKHFYYKHKCEKKEKQNQKEKASILKLDYLYKTYYFFYLQTYQDKNAQITNFIIYKSQICKPIDA